MSSANHRLTTHYYYLYTATFHTIWASLLTLFERSGVSQSPPYHPLLIFFYLYLSHYLSCRTTNGNRGVLNVLVDNLLYRSIQDKRKKKHMIALDPLIWLNSNTTPLSFFWLRYDHFSIRSDWMSHAAIWLDDDLSNRFSPKLRTVSTMCVRTRGVHG